MDVDASTRVAPGVLLQRVSGPLKALLACGAARYADDGVIELRLNAREVAEGGMVNISMWVPAGAPGEEALFSAWLAVRPGAVDGDLLEPSALLPGMEPLAFRVSTRR